MCGLAGTKLSPDERTFLRGSDPLGVILFKRNIGTPDEVSALTSEVRAVLGRDDAMVMVDQEGGRVQRLGPPHWRAYPAAARFAAIDDLDARTEAVKLGARLIAHDLAALGIDVDCLPVLDVPVDGATDAIGSRAYSRDPAVVARLGRAAADGLLDGGVLPVMKHAPGHGRAVVDSHFSLPVVETALPDLEAHDFAPFRANRDLPAAMTAHVVYTAVDPELPGTISRRVVGGIIRDAIGFDGLLFSDDMSMKALPGSFRDKAEGLYAAGVDIALHCSGDLKEAAEVAAVAPELFGATVRRVERALGALRGKISPFDPVDAAARLDRMLAAIA